MSEIQTLDEKFISANSKIIWTDEHVNILVEWADKAMCYNWMHTKNYERYNCFNTWFTIPVIVMSTLTGAANFAQNRVPPNLQSDYAMLIGGINIIAGIITTVQNFLKISQLNEAHRVAAISWDKFYRKIKVEISKCPTERQNVEIYIKHCTEEFDRLMETSPNIEEIIIKRFQNTFERKTPTIKKMLITKIKKIFMNIPEDISYNINSLTEQQNAFKLVKKPEICNVLESVRSSVYKPIQYNKLVSNESSNNIRDVVKRKIAMDNKDKKITEFTSKFVDQYGRYPTEDEIIENLENEQENITKAVISSWVIKHQNNKKLKVQQALNAQNALNTLNSKNKLIVQNVKLNVDENPTIIIGENNI
jgi:hypothetical protein